MTSKRPLIRPALALVSLAMAATLAAQQPAPEQLTVAFSDPSRPGTLRVGLINGGITVKAGARKDVSIDVRDRPDSGRPPRGSRGSAGTSSTTGLRRLTQNPGFSVTEENNQMAIEASYGRGQDFEIQVPTRTNLHIGTVNNGAIVVEGVDGDLEINNTNGPITLTNVAGSVVANSVNGNVLVTLSRLTAQKAMAFTSFNGAVDVTLPASAKANLKLRSDRGDIFTDFDVQVKTTTTPTVEDTRRSGGGRYRIEVNSAVTGTINGGGPEFELRTYNGTIYVRKGA